MVVFELLVVTRSSPEMSLPKYFDWKAGVEEDEEFEAVDVSWWVCGGGGGVSTGGGSTTELDTIGCWAAWLSRSMIHSSSR